MKSTTFLLRKKAMLFCLLLFTFAASAQEFIITLDNLSMTTNELELDVMLVVPAPGVRLASVSLGINFNPAILNGGIPCTTLGCGSWSLIPGTIAPEISANGGLYTINTTLRSNADLLGYGHLRIVQPSKVNSLVDLVAGTYRVGRFKFINTVAWDINSDLEAVSSF